MEALTHVREIKEPILKMYISKIQPAVQKGVLPDQI
jgi:hypothetical protein